MVIRVMILLLWIGVMTLALTESGFACVVSRHRIHNTRYVLHDMDCNGIADTVYEYVWTGGTFVFVGSYPYSVRK